jgi:hypothetical protein
VALDPAGDFVVVWSSPQDGSSFGVFGQRYDAAGSAQGTEHSRSRAPAPRAGSSTSTRMSQDCS